MIAVDASVVPTAVTLPISRTTRPLLGLQMDALDLTLSQCLPAWKLGDHRAYAKTETEEARNKRYGGLTYGDEATWKEHPLLCTSASCLRCHGIAAVQRTFSRSLPFRAQRRAHRRAGPRYAAERACTALD